MTTGAPEVRHRRVRGCLPSRKVNRVMPRNVWLVPRDAVLPALDHPFSQFHTVHRLPPRRDNVIWGGSSGPQPAASEYFALTP